MVLGRPVKGPFFPSKSHNPQVAKAVLELMGGVILKLLFCSNFLIS